MCTFFSLRCWLRGYKESFCDAGKRREFITCLLRINTRGSKATLTEDERVFQIEAECNFNVTPHGYLSTKLRDRSAKRLLNYITQTQFDHSAMCRRDL